MSYIVAFVSFDENGKEFPMECFRTDLRVGDEVLVRRGNGTLAHAYVKNLQYLNWNCSGLIECKKSECTIDIDNYFILPNNTPIHYGVCTDSAFTKILKERETGCPCMLGNRVCTTLF